MARLVKAGTGMIDHREKRLVKHSAGNLFDLVVDVKSYPEFLPWCLAARIRQQTGNTMTADLLVGVRVYRKRFTSYVDYDRKNRTIKVAYAEGPLRHLENTWRFTPHSAGCVIDFHVAFAFHSAFFQSMMERVFAKAVLRMVAAFEARADALYPPVSDSGDSASSPAMAASSMSKA